MFIDRSRTPNDTITLKIDKQKDDDYTLVMRFCTIKIDLPLVEGSESESTLVLDDYRMECPKATPLPKEGMTIDGKYADLVSITIRLADNSRSCVTKVAEVAFGSHTEANRRRVREAVPMDWIEVNTPFGVRHVRRLQPKPNSDRQFIECRHIHEPAV